jgi:hypothetical protein
MAKAAMREFKRGKAYRFRRVEGRFKNMADGTRAAKMSFLREVRGRGVSMYLFQSAGGKWLETFTPWQLEDYEIEGAA